MSGSHRSRARDHLKKYGDPCGNSGVYAYEIGPDSITVQFKSGDLYLYDHEITGRSAVERMKRLAVTGTGLATYISQTVRKNYAAKIT